MVVPRLYLVRGRRLIYLSSFLISRAGGTASASTAEGEEDTDYNSASAITRLRVCVKVLATLKCSTTE